MKSEGCHISLPRYLLLHQQPFFTEGHFKQILRLLEIYELPSYVDCSLSYTEITNESLLKLPSFPGPDNGIIDQYALAFEKVLCNSKEIAQSQKYSLNN